MNLVRDALVDSFAQVLDVLHKVNRLVSETFGEFAVREHADQLQNRLVLSYFSSR